MQPLVVSRLARHGQAPGPTDQAEVEAASHPLRREIVRVAAVEEVTPGWPDDRGPGRRGGGRISPPAEARQGPDAALRGARGQTARGVADRYHEIFFESDRPRSQPTVQQLVP